MECTKGFIFIWKKPNTALEGMMGGAQVALSVERHDVGVDDLCHGSAPLFAEGWLSFSRSVQVRTAGNVPVAMNIDLCTGCFKKGDSRSCFQGRLRSGLASGVFVWLGTDWMPGWGQHAVMTDAGHWRVMDAGAAS